MKYSPFTGHVTEEQLKRNYSFDNVWDREKHGPFAPFPQLKGIGKYRMAAEADADFQISKLHKSMSDLTDDFVDALDDFTISGVDPTVFKKYKAMRRESNASNQSSRSNSQVELQTEYFDPVRGCKVYRGFSPAPTSSTVRSSSRDGSVHHRKNTSISMTSVSSDGDHKHRGHKGRQFSMPISEASTARPLSSISENADAAFEPRHKMEKPCHFDPNINTDSALASDASDDESTWMDIASVRASISRRKRAAEHNKDEERHIKNETVQAPADRHSDRPATRSCHKTQCERSKTVRKATRSGMRCTHSNKRIETKKRTATKTEASDNKPRGDASTDLDTISPSGCPRMHESSRQRSPSTHEEHEHPSDLQRMMSDAKKKPKGKRQNQDDAASIGSTSTTKAAVPLRNITAIRLPTLKSGHHRKWPGTTVRKQETGGLAAPNAARSNPTVSPETAQ